MMEIKKTIFFLLLPFFLGSCAPKVLTHVEKKYPSRVAADDVLLYEIGQAVPDTAERIGSVKVVDGGFSSKCNYDQVVALAKQETAKNGGNALALTDHRKPSLLGSSCHQIAGDMLWIGNVTGNTGAAATSTSSVPAGNNEASVEKTAFRHNTFYANVGYGFITSKYYLPRGASGHPKSGLDWQLGYDWVSRRGFGAGLMYSGYTSSYTYSNVDVKIGLAYVAPQFVMKQEVGRWGIEEKIGIGYFRYRESAQGESVSFSGVGYNFLFGAEYRLSDHIGIGANFGYICGSLPKQDIPGHDDEENTGIFRLHFDAGIRFHF